MPENGKQEIQYKSITSAESVYHISGKNYTKKEIIEIFTWGNQPIDGYHLQDRQGLLIVENPPEDICSISVWHNYLETVLRPEWESLHPILRRSNIVIRFVDQLIDNKEQIEIGGDFNWFQVNGKKIHLMRLSLNPKGKRIDVENLLFKLIHELAEEDFWQKTTKGELVDLEEANKSDAALLRRKDYPLIIDEAIANRRAVRALRKIWPIINGKDLCGAQVDRIE